MNNNSQVFSTDKVFSVAEKQYKIQDKLFPVADNYPRTLNKKGDLVSTKLDNWTEGFFPGCLWYIYDNNQQAAWKQMALKWTLPMEKLQYLTSHHDIGFLMYCSYGNAYRLTKDEKYKKILVQSATSLCTRFNEKTGCIKSWNYYQSWDGKNKLNYPVIIDNMMNLELLYFASEVTGDKHFAEIATKHAETTAKNHFRPDYSSYHVVNYDPTTGKVLFRGTSQGFADNSTWSRGQAWGIYGYTMVYRFTKRKVFLDLAKHLADYWLKNKNLPEDGIPYWDFNAGQKGFVAAQWATKNPAPVIQPRDASAAAITCSALFELSTYLKNDKKYYNAAVKILKSLSSADYLAEPGTNGNFLLKHCTGNLPLGSEIDVPLIYADYYYLEAMHRYNALNLKN
ncbi:MAG TPA: glucuronyl hydrolase [Paludibacter sp.]